MGFTKGNKSSDQVINVRKLYTGLANFSIVAVNPSLKQAEKLGLNFQKEPEYLGKDKNDNAQCRVDFWLKETNGLIPLTKMSFFISTVVAQSDKSGKTMFINKAGETGWGLDLEDLANDTKMDWFNTEDAREALRGESELTDFIKAFLNVNPREEGLEARLDSIADIASKGDVSELRTIITEWSDNEVRLLCGVKITDGGNYQDFFYGYFGRPSVPGFRPWTKACDDEYRGIATDRYKNVTFGHTLEFNEFVESAVIAATPEAQAGQPAGQPAGAGGWAGKAPDKPPF